MDQNASLRILRTNFVSSLTSTELDSALLTCGADAAPGEASADLLTAKQSFADLPCQQVKVIKICLTQLWSLILTWTIALILTKSLRMMDSSGSSGLFLRGTRGAAFWMAPKHWPGILILSVKKSNLPGILSANWPGIPFPMEQKWRRTSLRRNHLTILTAWLAWLLCRSDTLAPSSDLALHRLKTLTA